MISLTVAANQHGLHLEDFLEEALLECSVSQIRKWTRLGFVRVNGQPARLEQRVEEMDSVSIDPPDDLKPTYRAEKIELPVLLEGEGWICVDKPPGVPVIPERRGDAATIVDGILHLLERRGQKGVRPRVVHRLDKEASGVLIIALDAARERDLGAQFQKRETQKQYLAIVRGEIREPGSVELSIGADPRDVTRMIIARAKGKPALTRYAPLEPFRGYTLVQAWPETGRTHQIRIHLSAIGHPLAVDKLYGGGDALLLSEFKAGYRLRRGRREKPLISRLTLHAQSLEFLDPASGERRRAEAPVPKDLSVAFKMLRKYASVAPRALPGADELGGDDDGEDQDDDAIDPDSLR